MRISSHDFMDMEHWRYTIFFWVIQKIYCSCEDNRDERLELFIYPEPVPRP
jgi:hypothetical protein